MTAHIQTSAISLLFPHLPPGFAIRGLGDVRKAMLALHRRVIVCEQTFQAFRHSRLPVSNVGEEFRVGAIGRNSKGISTA